MEKRSHFSAAALWRCVCAVLGTAVLGAAGLLLLWLIPAQKPPVTGREAALGYRMEQMATDRLARAMEGYFVIPKQYRIPAGSVPAPGRSDGFGQTDDPEEIRELILRAADLLGDDAIRAWNPDTVLSPGTKLNYYYDETLLILCWKERVRSHDVTYLEVKLADVSQLRRKLAGDSYGYPVQLTASELAAQDNAVAACSADFYSFRTNGVRVYQGKIYLAKPHDSDNCFFTSAGDMILTDRWQLTTEEEIRQFVEDNDILFSLSFGPILLLNGENVTPYRGYPRGEVDEIYTRAAISQLGPLHYLFVTSPVVTCRAMGDLMAAHGCDNAYNLDGGQTAVCIFDGQPVNDVDYGFERTVSDALCFASALPGEAQP